MDHFEPHFEYPLPRKENLDAGMSMVLNLHNPLDRSVDSTFDPSLCEWDTAPTKARIMWLQGLGGRAGLGKQGSLIEQLARARYTYNTAANRVRLRPILKPQVAEEPPDHYLPPEGITDPNAGNPFMSLSPVFSRIVAFGGVGAALRMRITCKKFQMEFGPEDAGNLGLDKYEQNLKMPGDQVAMAEQAIVAHIEAARVSGKIENNRSFREELLAKPKYDTRVVKELLGMKRPVVQLLLVLACGCVLLDKDFSRGMEREYFRRSLCIILTDYYGGNGNKSFKKKFGGFIEQSNEMQNMTKPKNLMTGEELYEMIKRSSWFKPDKDTAKMTISEIATINSSKADRLDLDFAHNVLNVLTKMGAGGTISMINLIPTIALDFFMEVVGVVRSADVRAQQTGINVSVLSTSSSSAEAILRESDLVRRFLALHPPTPGVIKSGVDPLQSERDDLERFRRKMERRREKKRKEEERKRRLYGDKK
mmetsp:Transcript_13635/g.27889  ORF Transcript_13635/g.27889 Transcript_13635/m.27889 type:complete len:478 (-) Transcript_13635:2-1435(-)